MTFTWCNWLWWRVVDHRTIHYLTIHNKRIRSYDTGWWRREVVTMGSGEEGKWWRREVVTKGSGDEGKWWGREVVEKGSGDEGKWWRREVMMKGSGDEGKWWGREVVKKGSGDEGKWWRREVMMKGSGDEGKWWGREVVKRKVIDEGEWCMMLQGLCFGEEAGARNLVFFRVSGCRRRWKVPRLCGGCGCGRSGRDWFLLCVLQQWLFLCA